MNFSENIKGQISDWPKKITSLMEIHRQRFSKLNQKFKQRPIIYPQQSNNIYPIILPEASRPQPRQQPRSKQQQQIQIHFPSTLPTQRVNTDHIKNKSTTFIPNKEYVTLDNLTKILHVLQTQEKTIDNTDAVTDTSTSTTNSTKQRLKQHLQQTANRWYKPIRSSTFQQYYHHNTQLQKNIPLITIVSDSTQQMNIPLINTNGNSKYDQSEISTEIQSVNILRSSLSPTKTLNIKLNRQESLIMQTRGMHFHSYDHRYYINQNNNNIDFFQQQRLIRQT